MRDLGVPDRQQLRGLLNKDKHANTGERHEKYPDCRRRKAAKRAVLWCPVDVL